MSWFTRLFGAESKTVRDKAREAGIPESAIRHKGDGRKVRNDAFADNLEKSVERRARERRK